MGKKTTVENRAIVFERSGEPDHVAVMIWRGKLSDGRVRFALIAEYDEPLYRPYAPGKKRGDESPVAVQVEVVFERYEEALASVPFAIEMVLEGVAQVVAGEADNGRWEMSGFAPLRAK
jgi:hypothetical protein